MEQQQVQATCDASRLPGSGGSLFKFPQQQPSTTNANDEVDLENYFSDDDCCEYEYVPSSRLRDSLSDVPSNDDEDDDELETQQNRRFVRYDFI